MPPEDQSLTITRKSCNYCRKDYYVGLGACPQCGSELVEVKRDPFIGRTVADRYNVECLVGIGGMGVVYKAWHEALRRPVAIKVLRQQFLNDETSVKRFKQEAVAASRLAHPNIVALHDFGSTEDGYLYMVMDLLDGRSLAQLEKEKKTLGVERAIRIITQVCDALEHAHKNGIVHRDLKPGNIMLMETQDNPDFVKLVDFGIAKILYKEEDQALTQKGEVFGSPLYMSPEQCLGMDMDGRSDIYALGAVLYEALLGEVPHMGKNMIETIDKHIHAEPDPFHIRRPDLYIPERVEAVVLRALAKKPQDRPQTMKELSVELQSAVPGRTQALNLRTKSELIGDDSKSRGFLLGIATALASLVLVGAATIFFFMLNSQHKVVPSHLVPSQQHTIPHLPDDQSGSATHSTPLHSDKNESQATPANTAVPPKALLASPVKHVVPATPREKIKPVLKGAHKTAPPNHSASAQKKDRWRSLEKRITKESAPKKAKAPDPWAHLQNRGK